ncbi:sodium-independent sulfate anion transporter isoform X4 [Strix uralensis]|uniref:sodium-independent sulfate anion transporter isoform X4 n=1 Tax=Strix uralensis TaxID=36305 RepID=UPI003DA75C3C
MVPRGIHFITAGKTLPCLAVGASRRRGGGRSCCMDPACRGGSCFPLYEEPTNPLADLPVVPAASLPAAVHARGPALPEPRSVFVLALMGLLQGWGRRPGAGLPGRAGRAPGHEEPLAPSCPCGAAGCQDQPPDRLDLRHRTQRPRSPVCWPGCLLLPGDGLPAAHAHRQHPPGPPHLPAAALLHGSTQRHRPLPEHGGASQNDYRIDPNQELLAIGFANILGSFVSSYPITGSFGRTAVNAQSGVCTPAGGLVTGALVLLSLAYLTSLFYYIPKAALAAVIVSAVLPMFDAGIFRTLWRVKRLDLVPLCVTFLLCFWEVQYGIVAGMLVSGILLLYSIARPPVKVSEGDALLVQPGSSLHFPAIEHLRDTICSRALAAASPPRSVILDCCHISSIDYTVVVGLAELLRELRKHGRSLAFCGLQDPVLQVLLAAELEGFQHFPSREEAEQCGGAELGGSGTAPLTSETSLLPTGLIQ